MESERHGLSAKPAYISRQRLRCVRITMACGRKYSGRLVHTSARSRSLTQTQEAADMFDSETTSPSCEPDPAEATLAGDLIAMPDLTNAPPSARADDDDTVLTNAIRLALDRLEDGEENYVAHSSST